MALTLLRPMTVATPAPALLPFSCTAAAGPCDPLRCVCGADMCADEDHWLDGGDVDYCVRGGVRTLMHRGCHDGCPRTDCQPDL